VAQHRRRRHVPHVLRAAALLGLVLACSTAPPRSATGGEQAGRPAGRQAGRQAPPSPSLSPPPS
jgi:hypothetical protein